MNLQIIQENIKVIKQHKNAFRDVLRNLLKSY